MAFSFSMTVVLPFAATDHPAAAVTRRRDFKATPPRLRLKSAALVWLDLRHRAGVAVE
jgi:hypothetical protein